MTISKRTSELPLATTLDEVLGHDEDGHTARAVAATSHGHPASKITDSTTAGRTLLTAADAATQRTALDVPATAHTHASTAISDSTAVGRTMLTAADATAQRTALGITSYGASLLDDANAGAALTTLGISSFAQTLLDDSSAAVARTTLGIGLTLLGDTTASGVATIDFANAAWSYGALLLVCTHVVPATGAADLRLRLSVNAGSSWLATGYASGNFWGVVSGTGSGTMGAGYGGTTTSGLLLEGLSNGTTGPSDGVYLINAMPGVNRKSYVGISHGLGNTGSAITASLWSGYCDSGSASAATGVRLLASSGNLSAGRFQLYGLG
jgi:hypothetical protein